MRKKFDLLCLIFDACACERERERERENVLVACSQLAIVFFLVLNQIAEINYNLKKTLLNMSQKRFHGRVSIFFLR